ncbi:hypothetical protein KY358_05230 [Candidatus Woesearchaeota archaeon]|nr:hypothetical protein [Candidatus Woesearchaeota archaeon]
MDKSQAAQALKKVKATSQKRKFSQSIDLIINLRDIDIKKTDQSVNFFHTMHYPKGRKVKVCALVGPELLSSAKEVCDLAVSVEDFPKYQKKDSKRLAVEYDFFIAQATIMPKLAQAFGKVFGPKGKMPNPKAGCVVPPNANLKPLYEKLQKTVKLQTKNDPIIQTIVGNEGMNDEEVIDNIMSTYDAVVHHLPNGKNNIKNILIKLTMGKPVQVGKEGNSVEKKKPVGKKPLKKEEARQEKVKNE